MRVIITDESAEKYEYEFEQESVILGRGNKCDIVIQSDHISRKHLEIIFREGAFYLKDLTLSNWVSYNEEKLVKNTEIQYFDFAPLILPGGFSLKIEDENQVEDLDAELGVTTTSIKKDFENKNKSKIDIYNTRLSADPAISGYKKQRAEQKKKQKLEKETEKTEQMTRYLILAGLVFVLLGYYYYSEIYLPQQSMAPVVTPAKKVSQSNKRKIKKPKPRIKPKPAVVKKETTNSNNDSKKEPKALAIYRELIDDNEKCPPGDLRRLCTSIFGSFISPEGVKVINGELFVLKNYRIRLEKTFQNNFEKINKAINLVGMDAFIAAKGLFEKENLKKIEKLKLRRVHILVYQDKSTGNNLKSAYFLDPSMHRRFSDRDWEFAKKEIKEKINTNFFQKEFLPYLKLEYPLK